MALHRVVVKVKSPLWRRNIRNFSVYATQEYQDFHKENLIRALSPKEEEVILNFSRDSSILKSMTDFKMRMVRQKGNEDLFDENDIEDDFFTFSQRPRDPWIDSIILTDPSLDIPRKKTSDFLFGLQKQMKAGGKLVLLTRPRDCSHYPFFARAVEVWNAAYPPITFFSDRLQKAGFDVRIRNSSIVLETSIEAWMQELKERTFPVFSTLDDEEIAEGVGDLMDMLDGSEFLTFEEKMCIVTATKPDGHQATETLIVQEEGPPYGHCG